MNSMEYKSYRNGGNGRLNSHCTNRLTVLAQSSGLGDATRHSSHEGFLRRGVVSRSQLFRLGTPSAIAVPASPGVGVTRSSTLLSPAPAMAPVSALSNTRRQPSRGLPSMSSPLIR